MTDLAVAAPSGLARALLRTARPRQWLKNGLVVAAPAAAGTLTEPATALRVLLAFVAFSLVASGIYFANDARDAELDRAHPRKRERPVAAGVLPVGTATATALVLCLAGLSLGLAVRPALGTVLAAYVALNALYTLVLKAEPVLSLAAIATCFVARAVAGGVAAGVPLSHWFLLVVSFASLFVVAGKRYAEHLELGDERGLTRPALERTPLGFLRFVWTTAAAAAVAAYCLWAFAQDDRGGGPWHALTIVPFCLFLLQWALRVEQGAGGAPEELLLEDRSLLALGLAWAALFALAVLR